MDDVYIESIQKKSQEYLTNIDTYVESVTNKFAKIRVGFLRLAFVTRLPAWQLTKPIRLSIDTVLSVVGWPVPFSGLIGWLKYIVGESGIDCQGNYYRGRKKSHRSVIRVTFLPIVSGILFEILTADVSNNRWVKDSIKACMV